MNVQSFYENKTILLTGVTGFVGKVLLEKFVRVMPNFKRMYIMIRPKKTVTVQQRLDTEVFNSELFKSIFSMNPALKEKMRQKIIPFAGDLIMNGLGMD
jgi:thioester reductase-like protein